MTTETETDTIQHLDFEHQPPCEWATSDDGHCDQPAEWIIRYGIQVRPGLTIGTDDILVCTGHKDHMVKHTTSCPGCSRLITIKSVDAL